MPIEIAGMEPQPWIDGVARPWELFRSDARLRILLAHFPDAIDDLPPGSADLVLSGHLHGGQICLPGPRGKVRLSHTEFTLPRRDAPGGRHHARRLPGHRHDARAVPPGRPARDRAAAAASGMRSLVAALLEPVAYPSVYDVTVRAVGDGTISLAGDQDDLRREGVYGVYSERAYGRIGAIVESDAAGVVRRLEPAVGEFRAGDPVGVSL